MNISVEAIRAIASIAENVTEFFNDHRNAFERDTFMEWSWRKANGTEWPGDLSKDDQVLAEQEFAEGLQTMNKAAAAILLVGESQVTAIPLKFQGQS